MRWIYVSTAYHDHAKNVAKAMYGNQRLAKWLIPIMFSSKKLERMPWLRKFLRHRVVEGLPGESIQHHLGWEVLRLIVFKLRMSPILLDTVWEKGEFSIDRRAARLLDQSDINGVLGFEHGCLFSIKKAREMGKRSAVIFASVHHSMREKWVDIQYRDYPQWADESEKELLKRAVVRDKRRDEEAELADFIYTNSEVTRKSLMDGGFGSKRIIAVPLGLGVQCPEPQLRSSDNLRVLYVGSVALHKGFHLLQKAFLEIPSEKMVLNVYGHIRVDRTMLSRSDRIIFHGAVDRERLKEAYSNADVLVFPSFSDGFGQAAAEALGYGVPVIASENAGVSCFIKDGYNGFLMKPGDIPGLRLSLMKCLDDRDGLQKMKVGAFETAQSWTWEKFRAEWISQFPRS